ncbi:MAG: hypothetical protein Q7T55_17795 [Solirubrobacteraceae bacterium]|nr:hypothetical protein [Solirubrobacteraceae bacterium]
MKTSRSTLSSPTMRRGLMLAGVVLAAGLTAPVAAQAASFQKTLEYSCVDYRFGQNDVTLTVEGESIDTVPTRVGISPFRFTFRLDGGGDGVIQQQAGTIESRLALGVLFDMPGSQPSLPISVALSGPRANYNVKGPFSIAGEVTTPPIQVASAGRVSVTATGLGGSWILRDPTGAFVDVNDPTPYPGAGEIPGELRTSCTPKPGSENVELASYIAYDELPQPTSSPVPEPTATPVPTPTPTPKPETVVDYPFDLKGSASLKTLTKGTLPLSGSIAAKLRLPSQEFSANLALDPTSGKLTTLGFLPVDAKVNLVSTEPVSGSLKGGVLLANAKVRIKLPSVKTLGIELAGGANCQAKQISSIALRSTQEEFLPTEGGPIAGTFSISDLTGCGFLNNLVSPLTAGGGNAIALNLINP